MPTSLRRRAPTWLLLALAGGCDATCLHGLDAFCGQDGPSRCGPLPEDPATIAGEWELEPCGGDLLALTVCGKDDCLTRFYDATTRQLVGARATGCCDGPCSTEVFGDVPAACP